MAAEAMKRIRRLETDATTNFEPWLVLVERSIDIVLAGKDKERLQSDHLTRRATHQPVRLLLLFMMSGLVDAVSRLSEASARVHALVNVPEAILQCLACGFCEIDFSSSPGGFPEADYNKYFGGRDAFVLPTAGKKLMLAGLLVLVPALLGVRKVVGAKSLIDPDRIRPLQQRLVDAVRNPASHTIADFVQKDAAMLEGLCREWIEEWCAIEGLASQRALPLRALAPTSEQLMALVTG
jgi:hypothetical protein